MNNHSLPEIELLVSRLIDGQLSATETVRLDELLAQSPHALRRYEELLDNHAALCAIYPGDVYEGGLSQEREGESELKAKAALEVQLDSSRPQAYRNQAARLIPWRQFALAGLILTAVGLAGYLVGQGSRNTDVSSDSPTRTETQAIAGHATLRRSVDLEWPSGSTPYREGDLLPDGLLKIKAGVAEIDFFCGATLIVEGPATLDLKSDWFVHVIDGRLRANVPPAARGFVVKTADAEIVDLGTEFALDATADTAYVEVIDGEIQLRGGAHDGDHLFSGENQWLKGAPDGHDALVGLSTVNDLERRSLDAEAQRYAAWIQSSQSLRKDKRLVCYYPMAELRNERIVPNVAETGSERDGLLVGAVDLTNGRFGEASTGLEFDRPGARVRTRIDGEFQSLTLACWVRIDRLEHLYNALFMSDGYENGEMHWQIMADGKLMFSVMVDDTQSIRHFSEHEKRVVETAGLARVYYTEPIWDMSKSGQWFHLAVSYDPVGRRVAQYVNGEQVTNAVIPEKFHVSTLRIGPAEIGNWGQPFRKTPEFSVRNLNGAIDELAIFDAILEPAEVKRLFEQGKPLGY